MIEDRDLRERFASLREQTERHAASFASFRAGVRDARRPRLHARAVALALAGVAGLLVIGIGAWITRLQPDEVSVVAWKSPTAFLLDIRQLPSPGVDLGTGLPSSFLTPRPRPVSPSRSSSSREAFS